MANPVFVYADLTGFTFTMSAAEDPNFPLANFKTYLARNVCKSTSQAANQTFNIDLGAPRLIDAVVIENHNFNSIGAATVDLEYDTADNPAFTSPVNASGNLQGSGDPIYKLLGGGSATKRYWRVKYFGAQSAVPFIGNIFIGARFDWGRPYDFNYTDGNKEYKTSELTALEGTLRTSQEYGGRKTWKLNFAGQKTGISDSVRANWQSFFATVGGRFRPFYYIDVDGTTINYVHLDIDKDPSNPFRFNVNDLQGVTMKSQLTF